MPSRVAGRDELEIASFTEDEVLRLGAICAHLSMLAGAQDMSVWMEEDECGKQSSAWDIVSALLDRGRLRYKEEETVRARSLFGSNMADVRIDNRPCTSPGRPDGYRLVIQPSPEDGRLRESFHEQRGVLLKRLVEYSVGSQSNPTDGIRRGASTPLLSQKSYLTPVRFVGLPEPS